MKRASLILLSASILLCLLASVCLAGSYQGVCGIAFNGASDDRGFAVNKNPGSQYYGYFYGVTSGSSCLRIWKPDSGGTGATAYTDTGNKISYATAPAGCILMNAFVGPDDTVYVVDYGAKQIAIASDPVGTPTGGNLTKLFSTTNTPRGVFVNGNVNTAGTRAFVAEAGSGSKCEVYKFDGTNWVLEKDLGNLGLTSPYHVAVDKDGNSYWAGKGSSAPFIKKVDASLNEVTTWSFTKPAWLNSSWTLGGLAYVNDPADSVNPQYLYVSGYNSTGCIRVDMNGIFIDGYGNAGGTTGAPSTYNIIALSGPGGNSDLWLSADDQHNTYVLVKYPGTTTVAYKVHLQNGPQPPTALVASNDVYGQIRLKWTPPAPSSNDPTCYKIYRGTAPGNETLYATTTDTYSKWKDSAQGMAPGGPFYYYVKATNGAGDSASSNEVGPISAAASTAPAPKSKGVALSYSEINKADTVNNGNYDGDWGTADKFLTSRGVAYTKMADADTAQPNIENDDIAGYKLLILASNRDMSGYEAQCIKDYVKYSQGVVISGYNNTIANYKGTRQPDFALADVFRAHASTQGSGGSPWVSSSTYAYLKPTAAPETAALFAGIAGGAKQWSFNDYLLVPYTDGTASEVAKWYDSTGAQSIADPNDTGLVVGYSDASKSVVQSVLFGSSPWLQGNGTFSSAKLMENVLTFLGVTFSAPAPVSISSIKQLANNSGVIISSAIVSKPVVQPPYDLPGGLTEPTNAFYIEDPARTDGIKVVPDGAYADTISSKQIFNIAGVITTSNGEREVKVNEMVPAGIADKAIAPVHIGVRDIGGAALGNQGGVTNGKGLNNIGMLVNLTGTLTSDPVLTPSGLYTFTVDDGSGILFGSQTTPGIKVYSAMAPMDIYSNPVSVGSNIHLLGAVGAELDGTTVIPVIRMGNEDPITIGNDIAGPYAE